MANRRLHIAALIVVAAVAVIASVLVFAPASSRAVPSQSRTAVQASYERSLMTLINNARTRRGLHRLKTTIPLNHSARIWASSIARRRVLAHDPNLRASVTRRARCSNVTAWAENVAYTPSGARAMFTMYMRSPGHRANILSRSSTHVGLGVVTVPWRGRHVYWNAMKFVRGSCR